MRDYYSTSDAQIEVDDAQNKQARISFGATGITSLYVSSLFPPSLPLSCHLTYEVYTVM